MGKGAPDFSTAFSVVDEQLEDAEKRLAERRSAKTTREKPAAKVQSPQVAAKREGEHSSTKAKPKAERTRAKANRSTGAGEPAQVVKRKARRNLTLKVLDETEQRFNQLFHKLQLAGDGRRKQDLADEAFGLLFEKYQSFLRS